ncbi:hypothetical protein AB0I49_37825 [Streptomyces sp. NPDC050617]|uniref:hypothetical protein n=1 Tax=Streptomyces sp. NPDC050617 TaxID=3154628 RepID=UPI0034195954
MGPSPVLFTDFAENYWIGDADHEPANFFRIEQHCAYLATYWLVHDHESKGLCFLSLPDSDRRDASNMVRQWAPEGGSAAQTQYAASQFGGHVVSKEALTCDAASGELTRGTLIWFGNDLYAEAAVVTGPHQFLMYNPNSGDATARDTKGFISYIATKNSFVVKRGQGTDPATASAAYSCGRMGGALSSRAHPCPR